MSEGWAIFGNFKAKLVTCINFLLKELGKIFHVENEDVKGKRI